MTEQKQQFTDATLSEVFDHAEAAAPNEACGMIVRPTGTQDVAVVRAKNVCAEPELSFVVDPESYVKATRQGKILAVYHSHPNSFANPSPPDAILIERHKVPFLIVAPHHHTWTYTEPSGKPPPLEGRPWVSGSLDCYGIILDYYQDVLGITLPDPFRGDWDYDKDWDKRERSPFLDYVEEAKLVRVPQAMLRQHDILLLRWLFAVEHHVAVYLGMNEMLHHPQYRVSCKTVYGGFWIKSTASVWRHESMMKEEDLREA